MSALLALVTGSLCRDPVARRSKATGKQFVTCLIKGGTPAEALWINAVAFDTAAQSELLRLAAGDSVSIQGPAKIGIFEKNGVHHPSLDVTASNVLALRNNGLARVF
jgi:hypothetical protein